MYITIRICNSLNSKWITTTKIWTKKKNLLTTTYCMMCCNKQKLEHTCSLEHPRPAVRVNVCSASRGFHCWFQKKCTRAMCRVVDSQHVWKDLKFNWASKHVSRLNVSKISNAVKDTTVSAFLKKSHAVETLWKPLFSVCTDKRKHVVCGWFVTFFMQPLFLNVWQTDTCISWVTLMHKFSSLTLAFSSFQKARHVHWFVCYLE